MPKLRDGVIKRGGSWSYVIRVPDPTTGVSKPKWVGGFATEEAAKAARDEARVRARRGEYVNRSASTVADYLAEWVEALPCSSSLACGKAEPRRSPTGSEFSVSFRRHQARRRSASSSRRAGGHRCPRWTRARHLVSPCPSPQVSPVVLA
jgi:hypothetical protein